MHNRIKDIYALFAALALLAALFLSPQAQADTVVSSELPTDQTSWQFRVFLDDREIGYHNFYLAEVGEHKQLRSVAEFEYRLLFVKLFDYEHEALETWSGDCLSSIRSRTDSNGDDYTLDGRRSGEAFVVEANQEPMSLPSCVMSFAYWNPAFLEQTELLNTQDGRFLPVEVQGPSEDTLAVGGNSLPSLRYRLEAGDMSLDLWYSHDKRWLALESEVAGGRILRYEPVEG
jgi:hypothetical protein